MKAAHASALALLGWYLLLPPVATNGRIDISAPLGEWRKIGLYDSAQGCHFELYLNRTPPLNEEQWRSSVESARKIGDTATLERVQMRKRLSESVCIEDDDPRLKSE